MVPLVSKTCLGIHEAHPPRRKHLDIPVLDVGAFTRPLGAFLLSIATHLENLSVTVGNLPLGTLPQLLTAATHAPNLNELRIEGPSETWGPIFNSLYFLSRIKVLHLKEWWFPENGGVTEMECIAGLQSLEELSLLALDWDCVTARQTDSLWKALAALKNLRAVHIDFHEIRVDSVEPGALSVRYHC